MKNWIALFYALPLLSGAVIALLLSLLAWRQRQSNGAYPFIGLMLAVAIWSMAYAFEWLSTDLAIKRIWHNVAYLGVPIVPTAWFALNLQFSKQNHWLTPLLVATLMIQPLFEIALVWSSFSDTLWTGFFLEQTASGFPYLTFNREAGFFIHAGYGWLLFMWGTVLYIGFLRRASGLRMPQIVLLITAVLAPLALNILYILGINFFHPLDITPFALTTIGLFTGWFIFRFQFTDILPMARRTILESMRDGVIVLNLRNRIVNLNPAAQQILDFTTDEIVGHPIETALDGWTDWSQIEEKLQRLKPDEQLQTEIVLNRSDGHDGLKQLQYVDLAVSCLYDQRHRLTGHLLVLRDITIRKETEEALREREERYRNLIDISPDSILVTNATGEIIVCNQRALTVYGADSMDELLHRKIYDFIIPEQVQALIDAWQPAMDAGKAQGIEYTAVRKDGNYFPVEVNASVMRDTAGKPQGFVVVVRDISERKRAEEALRQAQRLESIGLLAGGVAHDFNNLLTSMLAQNSLALAKMPADSPAQIHTKKAIKSAERAADLTRQLLAYAGKGQFQVEAVNLNEIIEENVVLLETAVPKKIDLQLHLSPHLPPVEADRGQIQQVVMNLVLNAAEAIESKAGEIEVTTGIKVLGDPEMTDYLGGEHLLSSTYVYLKVHDTGIGMDEETVKRVFDPFFTTKPTGRGLGLSATFGIIRSHKGGMRIDSVVGQGTTFEVLFPANKNLRYEQSNKPYETCTLAGTVLIVDDEENVREALVDVLHVVGLETLCAVDGRQGVERYQDNQKDVDLVLLDMQMPVMNGKEALNALVEIDPEIKILLSSGYNEADLAHSLNRNGHTGFIQKPYDMDGLIMKVGEMLEGRNDGRE